MKHAVMLTEYLRTMYSQPDIEKARKHADAFLPKDRHGKLYPLSTPLKSFHNLGAGVALYMYMVHWWSLFFFLAMLVSFSSLVLNMEGDGLDVTSRNMYTIHSLGNAAPHHAQTRHAQTPPCQGTSSAPAPLQGAPGGAGQFSTPRGIGRAAGRPATASGARASRLEVADVSAFAQPAPCPARRSSASPSVASRCCSSWRWCGSSTGRALA